jgi:hypothetical protein
MVVSDFHGYKFVLQPPIISGFPLTPQKSRQNISIRPPGASMSIFFFRTATLFMTMKFVASIQQFSITFSKVSVRKET